jgi:hypothetical protein
MQTTGWRFSAYGVVQLHSCHMPALGWLGFAIFRFAFFVPGAQIEGDGHAGSAQLIRKFSVDHGSGHDHASYGQCGYSLGGAAAPPPILH